MRMLINRLFSLLFLPVFILGFVLGFVLRPCVYGFLYGYNILILLQESFVNKVAQEHYNELLTKEQAKFAASQQQDNQQG